MENYLNLVSKILENGTLKQDRTDVGQSYSCWGEMLKFDLNEGFPILTTRKLSLRIAFEETMFFLRGQTDTKILEQKNIGIWTENTSRDFLDGRGLHHLPEGDMGKGYGYQWRNFNGVDQLKNLVESLKNDPWGRRHNITAWNPSELSEMALPPCHLYQQYQIIDGKLNSLFFMRSTDVIYGLGYNIISYALINHMLAKLLGLQVGELVYMGADAHIYANQVEIAKQQVIRLPRELPTLNINKDYDTLEGMLELEFTDLELVGYLPHPDFKDKPPMAK
jgi:thymidylate synthase